MMDPCKAELANRVVCSPLPWLDQERAATVMVPSRVILLPYHTPRAREGNFFCSTVHPNNGDHLPAPRTPANPLSKVWAFPMGRPIVDLSLDARMLWSSPLT